jgi:hypothetical protein
MATEAVVNDRALWTLPPAARSRRGWRRPLAAGVAIALVGLLAGDRGARTANLVQGIDPLEILDLQVKPNVLFVVDSSHRMGLNPEGTLYVGGDDATSRLYRTKQALRELITDNDGKANFGIIDLNADQSQLALGVTALHSQRPGPLVYVTADTTGATWRLQFDELDPDFNDYNGDPECTGQPPLPITTSCSEEIHESFKTNGAYATPYQGRFYLASRLFRHGVKYTWDPTGGVGNFDRNLRAIDTTITCPPPPAGLLGDDLDEFNDGTEVRGCFQIENALVPGEITTYYLTSPIYNETGPGAECNGANPALCLVAPVPACTAASNAAALRNGPLRLELPLVTNAADPRLGLPVENAPGPFPNTPIIAGAPLLGVQPNVAGGIQIGGRRPLADALTAAQQHYTSTVFPSRPAAVDGRQRNFVIVITSGADDTGDNPVTVATAMRGGSVTPGANDITTMVVTINGEAGFATSAEHTALNALQAAGTLSRHTVVFGAATGDELRSSLNFAFSEAIASGIFSTESSITESIFEYARQANTPALPGPPPTPARNFVSVNPASRYLARVPTLLQSSFDMPGFLGHLRAFQSPGIPAAVGTANGCPAGSILRADPNGRPTCEVWDAGEKLRQRIWAGMCPAAAPGDFVACSGDTATFAEMRGSGPQVGASLGSGIYPQFTPLGSGALIQRRILTTARQGVFAYQSNLDEPFGPGREPAGGQCPVPLWPPTSSTSVGNCNYALPVSPAADTPGLLDEELGIKTMTFDQLQSRFAACLTAPAAPFPAGHPCLNPDRSLNGVATLRARREARETILAFMAGAQHAQIAGSGIPQRVLATGDILYQARFWALAESTLGVPAVVPPPLQSMPVTHTAEYLLYRDGVRDTAGFVVGGNPVVSGFGLRNPDKNAGPGVPTSPTGDGDSGNFEPLMTVVYHASNDMVHAFRGGPCPPSSCSETGGEELWGFVPYDQLEKLQERMQGQGRSPHTYMIANSVRFSDVFVPGNWTESFTSRNYLGRWRTVMVFGRGIAGKYYTALDITSPGQFNRSSLDTLPAFPIWSRGNPDTQRGVLGGGPNGIGGADYAKMGETWSVPAMAAVSPADFGGSQFAMFMGSGYATDLTNAAEGKIFYAVDALTGDVLHALDEAATDSTGTCNSIEAGETCPVRNALVANSAAYIPIQLQAGFVGNPAASTASMVYIGDLHGRMWKFITSSTGLGLVKIQPDSGPFADRPDQPIGNAVALLNISAPTGQVPHVYWATGNDRRVIPPDPFKFVAMADIGADVDGTVRATGLFSEPLDGALLGFRGTAQPATAFNATGLGRVFFIGTKFTDANVAGGDCASRFDSVLFALGAVSGGAVFDLDSSGTVTAGDKSVMISGKVNAIRGSLGQIVLDKGEVGTSAGGVQAPPAPPAPVPAPTTNEGSSGEVFVGKIRPNSNVCR